MQYKPTCIGTGLLALDAVLNVDFPDYPQLYAGGSCGNVLSILAFLGWHALPVARLANDQASRILEQDLQEWEVDTRFIERTPTGSTPIIIHRILKDALGQPKHKFEFKDPDSGRWLPQYKPLLVKQVVQLTDTLPQPAVFYFDRSTRAAVELAKFYRERNTLIFFEPSAVPDPSLFEEAVTVAHVVKFSSDRIKHYHHAYQQAKAPLEIETLGVRGLRYRLQHASATEWLTLPAFPIAPILDAAGAGDWTTAGFLHCLMQSQVAMPVAARFEAPIAQYLRYAQILGALNCCYAGARGLMYHVTREQLYAQAALLQKGEAGAGMPLGLAAEGQRPAFREKLSSLYSEV